MLADLFLDVIPDDPASNAVKLKGQLNTATWKLLGVWELSKCPYLVISSPSKSMIEFLTLILVNVFSPTTPARCQRSKVW